MHNYNYEHFIYPLAFGIGSSTDNLCVGFSYGIKTEKDDKPRHKQFGRLNLFISCCNAIGAGLAGYISNIIFELILDKDTSSKGEDVHTIAKSIVSLFSGLAFYYLALEELLFSPPNENDFTRDNRNRSDNNTSCISAIKLAIPMTLNNLAGGMVSGFSGIHWLESFVFALICSYLMMGFGYTLGRSELVQSFHLIDYSHIVSGVIFGILGNEQIAEYYRYRFCI